MKYIDANTLNYERPDTITPDFSDGLGNDSNKNKFTFSRSLESHFPDL